MIEYEKGFWGLRTLIRMYGSAFPRALPFSLSSSLLAIILAIFFQETLDGQFSNPFPYQTFTFIVGFMIVFRCAVLVCNLSELCTVLTHVTADGFTMNINILYHVREKEELDLLHRLWHQVLIHNTTACLLVPS
jgi:hypothetical protein